MKIPKAFVLGGTSGLGLELAWEGYRRGIAPIVAGRTAKNFYPHAFFPPNARPFTLDLTDNASLLDIKELDNEPIDYFLWVAGIFERQPIKSMTLEDIDRMIDTHLRGPTKAIKMFYEHRKNPAHMIVVASSSSWRLRKDETLYCALKAGKAAFARNFAEEVHRGGSGGKVTLINPGGIRTPNFWKGLGQDISGYMDPKAVAKIIWDKALSQEKVFDEWQILRNDDGTPNVQNGPKVPEVIH